MGIGRTTADPPVLVIKLPLGLTTIGRPPPLWREVVHPTSSSGPTTLWDVIKAGIATTSVQRRGYWIMVPRSIAPKHLLSESIEPPTQGQLQRFRFPLHSPHRFPFL